MTARPVYVIASPGLRATRSRWPRQLAELRALLPDAQLIAFSDLPAAFAAVPQEERPGRLARAFSAAVVVPDKLGRPPRRWVGPMALLEAQAFAAAGKPVHVYAGGELLPWAECGLAPADSPRWGRRTEVMVPALRTARSAA